MNIKFEIFKIVFFPLYLQEFRIDADVYIYTDRVNLERILNLAIYYLLKNIH